ncbi:MAG: hypothetical protein JXR96_18665 [Deltaproteobacteria bacterium]|nr:hypothetical protein [Deltaproteobacteria bacterium]
MRRTSIASVLLIGLVMPGCGEATSVCLPDSCSGHGECTAVDGAPACSCAEGYAGQTCGECAEGYQDNDQDGICQGDCSQMVTCGHGTCSDASGTAVCACDPGYTGLHCEGCANGFQDNDLDGVCQPDCATSGLDCGSHGHCEDADGVADCVCDPGHDGTLCDACAEGYCGLDCEPCPLPPTRLFALPKGSGSIHLGWRMVSTCPTCGYNVYRAAASDGPFTRLNDQPITDQTNFRDTIAASGIRYHYRITLVTPSGLESEPSHTASAVESSTDSCQYLHFQNVFAPYGYYFTDGQIQTGDVDGDGRPDFMLTVAMAFDDPCPSCPCECSERGAEVECPSCDADGSCCPAADDPEPNYACAIKEKRYCEEIGAHVCCRKVKVAETLHQFVVLNDGTRAFPEVDTGFRWHGEFPWIVWDVDADGRDELIGVMADMEADTMRLVIQDGRTGASLVESDPIAHQFPMAQYSPGNRAYMSMASLDGERPAIVLQLGIYPDRDNRTLAFDTDLQPLWSYFIAAGEGHGGAHMIRAADLDGDGRDEILHGGYCLNPDGTLRWEKDFRHPDVVFPADIRPDLHGLEILYGVELVGGENKAAALLDYQGGYLWSVPWSADLYHGHSGFAAEVLPAPRDGLECYIGYEMENEDGGNDQHRLYSSTGEVLDVRERLPPLDWNGDEIKDDRAPPLGGGGDKDLIVTADVIGDYREEYLILRTGGGHCCVPRYNGHFYVLTNTGMNPNGMKRSPWEDHLYALEKTRTGY